MGMVGGIRDGSDVATSSAQLRGGDGGEVIRMGLGIGPEVGDVCELVSCVPRGVVWMMVSTVWGIGCVGVGVGFGMST